MRPGLRRAIDTALRERDARAKNATAKAPVDALSPREAAEIAQVAPDTNSGLASPRQAHQVQAEPQRLRQSGPPRTSHRGRESVNTPPSPYALWEIDHQPERPLETRAELRRRYDDLELEIEKMERRRKHAGTRAALDGLDGYISELEREQREIGRKIGGRGSVIGSVYGTTPGASEKYVPAGAADLCRNPKCRAPITNSEGFNGAGWCEACLYYVLRPSDPETQYLRELEDRRKGARR
jgi:hypothetical protein